jgi:hypothetical protein
MPSLAVAWPTMSVASEARNLPERILNVKGDTGRLREALKGQQGTAKNVLVPAESLETYLSQVEQALQDVTVNLMDQCVIKEVRDLRQEIAVQNEAIKRELNTGVTYSLFICFGYWDLAIELVICSPIRILIKIHKV